MIDCVAFSLLHPEAVFLRDTAEYSKSANNYFAAFENEVDPMCIVRPRSAGELRKIVKYLSTISPLPQVAIKGGGHTAWAGAANIQDGVLIDMINFDEITVNHNTKTVSIGAGQRWGNVYKQLVPLGLGMHDGRVSKVGLFFTTNFRNSKQVMLKAKQLHQETAAKLKSVPGFVLALTLQPLTKQALQESKNQGESSLGLSPADGPLVIVLLNSVHQNKGDDSKVISRVQKLREDIESLSEVEGVAAKYRFLNYAYKCTPVFQGYGSESIAALKAASKKYDPTQFFQEAVPGGFKISEGS